MPLQWGRDLSVTETWICALCAVAVMESLQWGRDLSVTETSTGYGSSKRPQALQWGRDLSVTETRTIPALRSAHSWLQWGRDLSVTETCCTPLRESRKRCFNGAATFQSRKPQMRAQYFADQIASMGPRPFSHGNTGGTIHCCFLWGASMGPRPFSHGNALVDQGVMVDLAVLQWGRDLSVTETTGGSPLLACSFTLQWGRDLSVTETTTIWSGRSRRSTASMGPRPFSHGNTGHDRLLGGGCRLQWGRDLSVTETACSTRLSPTRPLALSV